MASISSPGLGSGLDVSGIITKLMQVESQPLTRLTQQEASYQAKLTAFGSVKGALSALQTAAQTLKSTSTFTGKSASVSDTSVLSASSTSTASAASYDISITTLAKNHIIHSTGNYELTDGFNGGTLAFQIGSDSGSGGTTKSVTIPNGSTLSQVRDAINAGSVGVTASVVNDGTTNRLVLSATTTGSAGNIRISATQSGTGNTQNITDFDYIGADGTMKQDLPADNAVFKVNGLEITRSSNTVTDAIDGVTLSLSKEASTAKVTIAANSAAATAAVDSFVKAYNEAITQLKTLTAYDEANKKASVLTGDSTARTIQAQLSALVQTSVTGITGGITRLSNIGITVQKDGTLATNSSTLAAALADPGKDVAALFTQTTSGNKGIAVQFNDLLENIVGTSGMISGRTEGLDASIRSVQKRADAMSLRLTQIESRYRRQFTSLDSLISSMQQTSAYLTQQLASLPSTSSS